METTQRRLTFQDNTPMQNTEMFSVEKKNDKFSIKNF